ncbi:MAG: hypothetical protein Q9168_003375 [Polycauliona sp. 1 TL-2023]
MLFLLQLTLPILLPLFAADVAMAQVNGIWPKTWNGYTTYWNGPWTFMGCTETQGEALHNVFAEIGHFATEKIIPDAKSTSTLSSKYGFNAMFSSPGAGAKVAQVFQDIVDHQSQRTLNPSLGKVNYVVACTNPPPIPTPPAVDDWLTKNVRDATETCKNGKQFIYTNPQLDIYVCPNFFNIQAEFPRLQDCPAVVNTGFNVPNMAYPPIADNQLMITINTLSRKYAANAVPTEGKIFDLNQCFNAKPDDQLNNGFNYGYYAAFVVAGCTKFPPPRPIPPHLLVLVEFLSIKMGSKQLVLITGANSGIGFETARQLLTDPNYHVLLGSRSIEKGQDAIKELQSQQTKGTVELIQIDVTSEDSVAAAAKDVEKNHGKLDALVNNAGIAVTSGTNAEQLTACLQTNAVGAQLMGDYFAPLLRKTSGTPRIVNVTSGAGSIGTRLDRSHPAAAMKVNPYRISKCAMNMVAACQWFDLGAEGFKVFIYGPGYTESNFSPRNKVEMGAKPVGEGVAPIVAMLKGERDGDSGQYVEYGQESFPW